MTIARKGGRDQAHRWNWILTGLQLQVGAV